MIKEGVFISFSSEDSSLVDQLENLLSKSNILYPIRITTRRNSGILNSEKISKGIDECKAIIPILTKKSIKNQWVNQEIGFATAKNKEFYPILERNLLGKLKGFINKEIDQPYLFEYGVENKSFKDISDLLIKDIEDIFLDIIINEIKEPDNLYFKGGEIIAYENSSRHVLVKNIIHPLKDKESYDWLRRSKLLKSNEETWITKDKYDSYEIGRPIKMNIAQH